MLRKGVLKMSQEANKVDNLSKDDVQAFVQRKLQVLNQKTGARYERDAGRVIRHNLQK